MTTTEYPAVLSTLLEKIEAYRARSVSLDALKAALWSATETVSSFEERGLRDLLQQAEGRLDMIQFTVDEQSTFDETLKVIESVEASLRTALGVE